MIAPLIGPTSFVSNLSAATDTIGVTIFSDQGAATGFTTGGASGGYTLESVTLRFSAVRAQESHTFTAAIHAASGGAPAATALYTLSGNDPTGQGEYTFTCTRTQSVTCALDANTTYFLVASATPRISSQGFTWDTTASTAETNSPSGFGWSIADTAMQYYSNSWHAQSGWTGIFKVNATPAPSLTSSNIATTTATLTIANHTGNWYYKHTNTGATCEGPVSGTAENVTGLDASTSYTYSAYSDSTCTTANKLATATAFTTLSTLTASGVAATSATLTITGHTGNWYYKHTNTGATCEGPVSGTAEDVTGLDAGTSYTYSAYSDSTCTTANLIATAAQFTTAVTVSNLSGALYQHYQVGNYLQTQQQGGQAFTTGSNSGGYTLPSIEIRINSKVGSPTNLVVTLRAASGSNPDTSTTLAELSGNSSPSSAGTYPYTCSGSGCALAKDTTYFVLMQAASSPAASYYMVDLTSAAETKQTDDNDNWSIADKGREDLYGTWYDMQAAVKLKVTAVPEPSLDASGVTASGATLTVAHVNGAWYYKRTAGSPADATCRSVAAGTTTATLTGLTAGTSYTYKAYDASGCADADEVASAQFTTPVTVSNLSQSTSGRLYVGNNGSVYANQFRTGGNSSDDYTLSGVTADFAGKTGSPGALQMQVWTDSSGSPGSLVSGLTLGGNDPPDSGGQATHTCSGNCTLTGNTNYWVRLSASGGSGNYWRWNYTSSGTETVDPSGNGWQIGDNKSYYSLANIWIDASGYFKIKVTAVPD